MNGKAKRGQTGFTLVELIVVMAIIAILATIAVPMFLGQRTKAIRSEALTNLESLRLLEEQYFAEMGTYTPSAGDCTNPVPANVAAIRGVLPGFKPGDSGELFFNYCIIANKTVTNADSDPCFWARAFGKAGTAVEGQELGVDCNNEEN